MDINISPYESAMQSLLSQFDGLNLFKDILVPMLAAFLAIWLATRKFRSERLWQEKYTVYQEILASIEAMHFWAEEAAAEVAMLPTIGGESASAHAYSDARRRIAKHAAIGRLLLSTQVVAVLTELGAELFREEFRANDERSHDPREHDENVGLHAQEIKSIVEKYLPRVIEIARNDLGA